MASVTAARIGNPRNMTSPVVSWLDDGNPEKVVSGRHDLLPRLDRCQAQAHRIPRTTAASRREALRALQLIDIRARDDKTRGPGDALLILHVLISQLHHFRGVDLVLGEHRAGL